MGETLAELGHHFNDNGELVDVDGNKFVFSFHNDKAKDQKRYEKIGEAITQEVYTMLQERYNLVKQFLPLDADDDIEEEKRSFVFHSKNFGEGKKILVLINGAGVVRAGQWTRKLIMNHSLEEGTMFPYIENAQSLEYDVLVMNTNQRGIQSGSSQTHAETAWRDLVLGSSATSIVVVAHSAGGVDTMHLARTFGDDFIKRVKKILFTDSVHSLMTRDENVNKHLAVIGKNYVTSSQPAGTPLKPGYGTDKIPRFSSGHEDHIWTSHCARECIFKDLDELEALDM